MSGRLDTEAEILKLARLLDVEPSSLSYLDEVEADDLRVLRTGVTDSLFAIGGGLMTRLGNAAKRLPTPLVVTICERAFGPMLAARAAASTDPAKAVEIAQRLSPDFLTEVTIQLDPRRVAEIVSGVPTDLVAPVAEELGKRQEYVTMGRFLTYLSPEALRAALAVLGDEAVLRTAFVLEDKSSVDDAIAALPAERLQGVLRCASTGGLWHELLSLREHLSPARLTDIETAVDETGLRSEYDDAVGAVS